MFMLITQDGTQYPITRPATTIGREECDIFLLEDDLVSRQHAKVEQRGDALVLIDLDSTNGTYVNGVRLQAPYTLQPGDAIQIGGSTLTVYAEGEGRVTRAMSEPPPMVAPARSGLCIACAGAQRPGWLRQATQGSLHRHHPRTSARFLRLPGHRLDLCRRDDHRYHRASSRPCMQRHIRHRRGGHHRNQSRLR